MPSRSPYTALCRQAALARGNGKADLHVHSTFSDGLFTVEEVIVRAGAAGLKAVAITDHDTLGGYKAARAVAEGRAGPELIAGVEMTTSHRDREIHLLGYFIRPDDGDLCAVLEELSARRSERFEVIVERLRGIGLSIDKEVFASRRVGGGSLGRRHIAQMLVDSKQASNLHVAFARYLNTDEIQQVPKCRMPIEQAIDLIRAAGGVSSWAHPSTEATIEQMRELQSFGLNAVECEYPMQKLAHGRKLREMAKELGLAVTGGSDCHGPLPLKRSIGSHRIDDGELDRIRMLRR